MLEEVTVLGRLVSIEAASIETIEPMDQDKCRGGGPLCLVGLRSARTVWVRSHYEPLVARWRAALGKPDPAGWRAGMREAVETAKHALDRHSSPEVRRAVSELVCILDAKEEAEPAPDPSESVDAGFRSGMAEAARMIREALTGETAPYTRRTLTALERAIDARAAR